MDWLLCRDIDCTVMGMNPYHMAAEAIGTEADYSLDFSSNLVEMNTIQYLRKSDQGCNTSKPGGMSSLTLIIIIVVAVLIVLIAVIAVIGYLKFNKNRRNKSILNM